MFIVFSFFFLWVPVCLLPFATMVCFVESVRQDTQPEVL